MMPRNLVLVRHMESEGNVANHRSKLGDDALWTPEFMARHSSSWRLTDLGRLQGGVTGAWIRDEFPNGFDRGLVSGYVRTMESAGLLDIPNMRWFVEMYLRERDYGVLDVMTAAERRVRYADILARRNADSFCWRPLSGESIADLCMRVDRVLATLHREASDQNVIAVVHGEVMWAFRVRLERMTQARWRELDASKDPLDRIHNGQVLHYTRVDPVTGEERPSYGWMRSVCPTDLTRSRNDWEPIVRQKFSNEELLAAVESSSRMIAG